LAQPEQVKIDVKWELGYADSYAFSPQKWIPATVPGAVQLDMARAEKYEPLFYAENWRNCACL
jgi:beta-mannosidase